MAAYATRNGQRQPGTPIRRRPYHAACCNQLPLHEPRARIAADMGGVAVAGARLATWPDGSLWTYGQCGAGCLRWRPVAGQFVQPPGVVARIELPMLLHGPVKVVADHGCDHVHDVVPVVAEGAEPLHRLPCPGRVIGQQPSRSGHATGTAIRWRAVGNEPGRQALSRHARSGWTPAAS